MTERVSVEVIPGVSAEFSATGIDTDVTNAWLPNSMAAMMGDFNGLEPVKHYDEYFRGKDAKYEAAGKPGLLNAVMQNSNPMAVAAFDQLVDEFNNDLPRIQAERDNKAVKAFYGRVGELKEKIPEDQNNTGK